ncbi:MAG: high-potential iron-sulfur protein [Pseudomonadota bacterium]|nr:high-potential iron-sulfur protein [Pseudomonadota bacterium]
MSRPTPLRTAVTRRSLVKNLSLAAVVTAALPLRRSQAAELPHLDVKDPAAMAVGYLENVSQVDLKKYPTYIKGSNCENCLLLQGTTGSHYRPCNLFPGKAVSVSGWCSGWTAEM